jgi:predicted dehydrogenase
VQDIKHQIVAIGSSSSLEKAKEFAKDIRAEDAQCYGGYDELLKNDSIDVVYVSS